VHWLFATARLGQPALRWVYPVHPVPTLMPWVGRYLALLGRLSGHRFPLPERCDLASPEPLIDWLAEQLHDHRPLVLWTTASAGVRLAVAARLAGRDLSGMTFLVGAEAVSATRRRQIEASGAQVIVQYGSVELSGIAFSCATPSAADDVHVMADRYAVVSRPRPALAGGPSVEAMMFTSLAPSAEKIGLNAELGDTAVIDRRACGCRLGTLGLNTHLSEIRSFEKLTSEGVTFARSNLERILEEVLPARFGGVGLDYQIGEEEAADSIMRLVLRVSPAVGEIDDDALRTTLLNELGKGGQVDQYQARIWRDTGTIEIRREAPIATQAGKMLPFQRVGR
jgi:hypothetical protein